jgi:hypothetical protein
MAVITHKTRVIGAGSKANKSDVSPFKATEQHRTEQARAFHRERWSADSQLSQQHHHCYDTSDQQWACSLFLPQYRPSSASHRSHGHLTADTSPDGDAVSSRCSAAVS